MKIFRFVLDLVSIIALGVVDITFIISMLIGYHISRPIDVIGMICACIIITYTIILLGKDVSNILELRNEDNK